MLETNKFYLHFLLVACLATPVAASWWDDFTNNLATDLTPLIALFGEQATKQFLSESTTILDNFIFAMAPLGILTGVVSAIRVCGGPSLRAFIGRAQEGGGIAEAELCSSTSRDVCELYRNGAIVRVFGRPKILEIVYDPVLEENETGDKREFGINISREYYQKTILNDTRWQEKGQPHLDNEAKNASSSTIDAFDNFAPNPNLSLNIGIVKRSSYVYVVAAIFGFLAQSSVIVLAGIVKYKLNWKKDENTIDPWAFPFIFAGTICVCFGMFLCATLVNDSTKERVFERKEDKAEKKSPTLYVVQPGNQVVGDQTFDPFLISKSTSRYMTSWKAPTSSNSSFRSQVPTTNRSWRLSFRNLERPSEETSVLIATSITTLGFALQFVGLRAMHSIVSLLQLAVTIMMSLVRALLRTQRLSIEANVLRDRPDEVSSHELDWLALQIGKSTDSPRCYWNVVAETPLQDSHQVLATSNATSNKAWEYRSRLAKLTGQLANANSKLSSAWDNDLVSGRLQAQQLKNAIEDSMSLFIAHAKAKDDIKNMETNPWSLKVATGSFDKMHHHPPTYQSIDIPLGEENSLWTVDQNLLEAIIGLWSWSIISDPRTEGETFELKTSNASDIPVYRAIAAGTRTETEQTWREIQFWIGSPNLTLTSFTPKPQPSNDQGTDATTLWQQGNPIIVAKNEALTPVPLFGKTDPYQRLFGWHGIDASNRHTVGAVKISSKHIPTLCSQDIYQSFLCTVAAYFDLGKDTTTVTSDQTSMRLEHQLITKLTECFEESGLGSRQDAALVIIPALHKNSLLPRVVEAVPTAYRVAEGLRKSDNFKEAEEVLRWAWGVIPELSELQETAMIELGELYRYALFSERWQVIGKEGIDWMNSQKSSSMSQMANEVIDRYVSLEKRPRERRTGQHVLDAVLRRQREETLWSISQLEKGIDFPMHKESGRAVLSLLSQEGWFELVRAVLEVGSIVDSVDSRGRTPLSYAAEHGHLSVVSILMEASALPMKEDSSQRTPLSYAAGEGHVPVIEKLLSDPRVNIHSKDVQNRSLLHWAAINGHQEAIIHLVDKGARLDDMDSNNHTPLLAALSTNQRLKIDRKQTADLLVRLKSKVDFLIHNRTALEWTLRKGEFTSAEFLLEHHEDRRNIGIFVDFAAREEWTIPHFPPVDSQSGFHVRFFNEDNEKDEPTMHDLLELAQGECKMRITYITNGLPNREIVCERRFRIISTLLDGPQEVGKIEKLIEAAAGIDEDGIWIMSMLLEHCETQSETPIQITDKAVRSAADEDAKGKDIMIFLLGQQEGNIHITEEAVSAIAEDFDSEVMALLLKRHGGKSLITQEVVNAAAKNREAGRDVMALLLDQGGSRVLITEETLKSLVTNPNGSDILALLLDRREHQIQITEEVIKLAAAGRGGREFMELLLNWRGDRVKITEEVLKAAAGDVQTFELLLDRRGDQVQITEEVLKAVVAGDAANELFALLLHQRRDQIQITEEVLKAAAGSQSWNEGVVHQLLDMCEDQALVTQAVLNAAAGRHSGADKVVKRILDERGKEVQITEEVVKIAAGKKGQGSQLMQLLLDRQGRHIQITDTVMTIAAGNDYDGRETLEFLLERRGNEVQITENMLKAVVGTDYSAEGTLESILDSRGDEVYVTESLVKAIVDNQKFGRKLMRLLLDRREGGFQVTEDVMKLLPLEWKYARRKMMEILHKQKSQG